MAGRIRRVVSGVPNVKAEVATGGSWAQRKIYLGRVDLEHWKVSPFSRVSLSRSKDSPTFRYAKMADVPRTTIRPTQIAQGGWILPANIPVPYIQQRARDFLK